MWSKLRKTQVPSQIFRTLKGLLSLTNLSAIFELAANSGPDIESVGNWKPLSDHCHTGSDWDQSTGSYELYWCHKQGTEENDGEGSGGHAGEDSYARALDGE